MAITIIDPHRSGDTSAQPLVRMGEETTTIFFRLRTPMCLRPFAKKDRRSEVS